MFKNLCLDRGGDVVGESENDAVIFIGREGSRGTIFGFGGDWTFVDS